MPYNHSYYIFDDQLFIGKAKFQYHRFKVLIHFPINIYIYIYRYLRQRELSIVKNGQINQDVERQSRPSV